MNSAVMAANVTGSVGVTDTSIERMQTGEAQRRGQADEHAQAAQLQAFA